MCHKKKYFTHGYHEWLILIFLGIECSLSSLDVFWIYLYMIDCLCVVGILVLHLMLIHIYSYRLLNWNLGIDWEVFSRIWLKRECSMLFDARNGSHCFDCVLQLLLMLV